MTTRRTFLGWLAGAAVSAVLPVAALLRCEPEVYEWLDYRACSVVDVMRWFNVPTEHVEGEHGGLLIPASFEKEWTTYWAKQNDQTLRTSEDVRCG